MWQLNLKRLGPLTSTGLGNIAIESGTCRGNGTRLLAKNFERVISIELSKSLHLAAKARLAGEGFQNVELLQGDSASLLPKILESLPSSAKVFFFLDAHWSGDSTVRWSESAWAGYGIDTAHLGVAGQTPTSQEQCPLDRELQAIVKYCRSPASLLIDDTKNLAPEGKGRMDVTFVGEDWSHLNRQSLRSILAQREAKIIELQDPEQWFVEISTL